VETVRRLHGWMSGSVEHSVIRVVDEGIEFEGVVLGGSPEAPFAIRYAVMAESAGRCRGVTARAIGEPILLELFSDGAGRWTDDDGVRIRELEGAIDVDLGITPVTHALAVRRLGLGIGEAAKISVACLDVLAGEIRSAERRYERITGGRIRVEDSESGVGKECRWNETSWALEVMA
jgi:hypothetical protein